MMNSHHQPKSRQLDIAPSVEPMPMGQLPGQFRGQAALNGADHQELTVPSPVPEQRHGPGLNRDVVDEKLGRHDELPRRSFLQAITESWVNIKTALFGPEVSNQKTLDKLIEANEIDSRLIESKETELKALRRQFLGSNDGTANGSRKAETIGTQIKNLEEQLEDLRDSLEQRQEQIAILQKTIWEGSRPDVTVAEVEHLAGEAKRLKKIRARRKENGKVFGGIRAEQDRAREESRMEGSRHRAGSRVDMDRIM